MSNDARNGRLHDCSKSMIQVFGAFTVHSAVPRLWLRSSWGDHESSAADVCLDRARAGSASMSFTPARLWKQALLAQHKNYETNHDHDCDSNNYGDRGPSCVTLNTTLCSI